jgi:hypothetical protein
MVLDHLYWVFVEQASRLFVLDKKIFYQQAGRLFHDLLSHFTRNSDTNYFSPSPSPFPPAIYLLYISINLKVKWNKKAWSQQPRESPPLPPLLQIKVLQLI